MEHIKYLDETVALVVVVGELMPTGKHTAVLLLVVGGLLVAFHQQLETEATCSPKSTKEDFNREDHVCNFHYKVKVKFAPIKIGQGAKGPFRLCLSPVSVV